MRSDVEQPELTAEYVLKNARNRIQTTVFPDVNVLYTIRDVYLGKEEFAASGLDQFVKLITGCFVDVSSGLAFSEIIPNIKQECLVCYDIFCNKYLLYQDPTSHKPVVSNSIEQILPSLHETDLLEREIDALLPYYYVTKIHQTWLEHIQPDPLGIPRSEVFQTFLNEVVADIDLLSGMEIEIAAYCFCNDQEDNGSQPSYSNDAKKKIATIRKNFLGDSKHRKSFESHMRCISNAVRDLRYFYVSRVVEGRVIDGLKQDTWIATYDGKLAEVAKHFYAWHPEAILKQFPEFAWVPAARNLLGNLYSVCYRPHDIQRFKYWRNIDVIRNNFHKERLLKNAKNMANHIFSKSTSSNLEFFQLLAQRANENVKRIRAHYYPKK